MMTGTLNMADLARRLPALNHTSTVQTGFAFITVGILLKRRCSRCIYGYQMHTPMHPRVSIFLAATATKVAIYLLMFCILGFQSGLCF